MSFKNFILNLRGGANYICQATRLNAALLLISCMLAIDYEMTPLQAQSCVHSGTAIAISTNTTWSTTMNPVGDVEILAGATLTITGTVT